MRLIFQMPAYETNQELAKQLKGKINLVDSIHTKLKA
jgi:hypothetical protein